MNYLKNGIIFVLSLSLVFVSIIAFQEYKENQRYGRLIIGDQVVSAKNEAYLEEKEMYGYLAPQGRLRIGIPPNQTINPICVYTYEQNKKGENNALYCY